jgi:Flp pilus assembly pilin Flp
MNGAGAAKHLRGRLAEPRAQRLLLGDWGPLIRDPIDVLRAALLVGAVAMLATGDWNAALRLFGTFALTVVARLISLPRPFDLAFVVGMSFQGWGNALDLFGAWDGYDKVVHFVLPAAMAPMLYILLARLDAVPDLTEDTHRRQHLGIFIVSMALGMTVGVGYEMYEYAMVKVLGANLQIGYGDTIGDLVDDAFGSALGAGLLILWAERGWQSIRRVPADRIESDAASDRRENTG